MAGSSKRWPWCVLFLLVAASIGIFFLPLLRNWVSVLSDPAMIARFTGWADSVGWVGVPVLLLFQILQIVIAVLPGGLVELAGGILYGPLWGFLIALTGILLGTLAAFWVSRVFGVPLVRKLVNPVQFDRYERLCQNPRFESIALLFFFLPGVPKDVLIYVIGCSGVLSRRFIRSATLVRIPSVAISSFAGAVFGEGNFGLFTIVYMLFLAVGGIGALIHRRILKRMEG